MRFPATMISVALALLTASASATAVPCEDVPARGMVGVLFSRQEAVIATEVAGRLEAIYCELGQTIPAGAVVARIDDRALRESLARAEATLQSAEAEVKLRESEKIEAEERYQRRKKTAELYSPEELSRFQLERDRAVENSASATASAKAHQATVAEIRLRLDAARIRAPFRGVAAARYQTPGTWVDVGAPVVRLVGSGELWVRFAAPPRLGGCLISPARIVITVPDTKDEIYGVVRHVSPEVDPASGLLTIEASVETSGAARQRIHSGLAVRVRPAGGSQR